MSVMRPRNRVVYFRLSEEEFEKLSRMCSSSDGARSVSELSRSAVQKLILNQSMSTNGEVAEVLNRVQTTVSELSRKVESLMGNTRAQTGQESALHTDTGVSEDPTRAETGGEDKS